MAWTPRDEGLQQLLPILKDSQSPGKATQLAVQETENEATRSMSGLILKNNIRMHDITLQPEHLEYIKHQCLQAVGDSSPEIRGTVGILITTIASNIGLHNWPQLLPSLCEMLDNQDYNVCEGAFSALQKICEDSAGILENMPLNTMIPKFLEYFKHSSPKIRSHAIACINQFIINRSQALMLNIDSLIQNLLDVPSDNDPAVRMNVCHALVGLVGVRIDLMMPHMSQIIELILLRSQDADENVALQATEFWLSLGKQRNCRDILSPILSQLVPVLVSRTQYTETDIILLKGDVGEDDKEPDRQQDISPRFHMSRVHGISNELDENSDDDMWDSALNLRKCSACALDIISKIFGDVCLPLMLPILKEALFHQEWVIKESGVMALGAIAEGCMQGLIPHLPELIPYLITCLSDKKPLVRSITCWTFMRFPKWVLNQPHDKYLEPLIEELLKCILDSNKRVQEAACSAFVALEEEACTQLVPYLENMLKTFVLAFSKYHQRNLLIMYDVVGLLAESVGHHLNKPQYIDILMPPLMDKWNLVKDDDKDIIYLLECLSSIATALQSSFLPYCDSVYRKGISIIEETINQDMMCKQSQSTDYPDKERMVIALDLVSGLIEGLQSLIEPLVANSKLLQLLCQCMGDVMPEVRQSSFALLGDLSGACFSQVYPYTAHFILILVQNLNPSVVGVCNNAVWAIGQICVKLGEETKPYVRLLLSELMILMNRQDIPKNLSRNAAITLGRLGNACPDEVAPYLPEFLRQWCLLLRYAYDHDEKYLSFMGMCHMIRENPGGVVPDFLFFCDAIASWDNPPQDLRQMIRRIIEGFKNQTGAENWLIFLGKFPQPLACRLIELYDIEY
uniref:Uncharacterized protein n=2 Tax=Drosophila melanogaster TaxID=7227 RepID=Q9VRV9_DROME|nr:uncharacterized protein Dmel_CG8219 [Drosophila melanogaster]AAF50673.2 uncharacterized protein Dmel_CG8219 [Drosophila melanogaster]|eukprot:NP_648038.1 uncharacterized protein Dmel_CG8219 [Drosophila melanogaster]